MSDEAILIAVLVLRLGIPLLIIRYPLPAIIAALVLDAADQTIFQNNTDLDLTGYQGYDKALDIYYLAIAYLSTLRNWKDPFAARVAQFLWYYRLVGVVAFELLQMRALLLVFPNTFEYFFIAYEAVRLWWKPDRIPRRAVIGMAAAIWIFVKLPQEWWIHVAQLDFTDFMKEDVFGVTVDTSWGDAISENLWFVGVLLALAGLVAFIVVRVRAVAPPPDWRFTVDVQAHPEATCVGNAPAPTPLWSWELVEKVALLGMITIIFSQVIPSTDATPTQVTLGIIVFVVLNGAVTQWLASRGTHWRSIGLEFGVMAVINLGISLLAIALVGDGRDLDNGALLFFVLLLTELVVLFDRYRPIRSAPYPPLGAAEQ